MTDDHAPTTSPRIGCYPGSFDPPTVAHLAVAEAALAVGRLGRVDLVVSQVALGKGPGPLSTLADRLAVLEAMAATRPWLGVVVTERTLVADLAEGYDLVVMGADKWRQINELQWYGGSAVARDAAIARLPRVLVVPRGEDRPTGVEVLEIDDAHRGVNASAVRDGDPAAAAWMVPEAATHDARTGAWTRANPPAD